MDMLAAQCKYGSTCLQRRHRAMLRNLLRMYLYTHASKKQESRAGWLADWRDGPQERQTDRHLGHASVLRSSGSSSSSSAAAARDSNTGHSMT